MKKTNKRQKDDQETEMQKNEIQTQEIKKKKY